MITPLLVTELLLSMVTATPEGGLMEAPELMVTSPAVEVFTGVAVLLLIVVEGAVWARAGAAQSSAEALTMAGPASRIRASARRRGDPFEGPWARSRAASGEKYPVINFDPSRRIDRSSMIVSSE
jgi:hypothetical protein